MAILFLMFILCFNLTATMLAASGVEPVVGLLPSLNYTNIHQSFNSTAMARSWGGWSGGSDVGDILGGMIYFFNIVQVLILGFPTMLTNMLGAPAPLVWVLDGMFAFVMALYVIEFISGRSTES